MLRKLLIALLAMIAMVPQLAFAQVEFPSTGGTGLDRIDHTLWDQITRRYVRDGLVDYDGAKADPRFEHYLAVLDGADLTIQASYEARLAFWINAYNALCIQVVLTEYPDLGSVRDLWFFFKRTFYRAGGRDVSLDLIEHEILRTMGEPRIHFAIVCASFSCPNIQAWAYTPAGVDSQLTVAAESFVNSRKGLIVDRAASVARFSMIFSWFGADFEASGGVPAFAPRYAVNEADVDFLRSGGFKVEYQEYN
ncbi:MAG: DUF547 domain-containing protein [Candidatus Latescibacteria bacterium]|jgi:hypothetical protein|nr:DUF547 domain-containing protein [Candidatus Latescibacterota bacterium]